MTTTSLSTPLPCLTIPKQLQPRFAYRILETDAKTPGQAQDRDSEDQMDLNENDKRYYGLSSSEDRISEVETIALK